MGHHPNARELAEPNTILRCLVGSTVHGISVSDQDDRDEMGVCVEPPMRARVEGFVVSCYLDRITTSPSQ